jgi:hypothetical protein
MRKFHKSDWLFLYVLVGAGGFNAVSTWGMTVFPVLAITGGLYGLYASWSKPSRSENPNSDGQFDEI